MSDTAWTFPGDEARPTLTRLLPAALASLGDAPAWADDACAQALGLGRGARSVLVILVDGLGLVPLADHWGHVPTLRAHRASTHEAVTVLPSTTAAAITAFGTGALPGATRMVGYQVTHGEGLMNLLAFAEGVRVEEWQEVPTFFERLAAEGVDSAVVLPPTFQGSGLTRAALRGARLVGAVSLEARVEAALRELRAGTPLVYLYWSEVDHAGHAHGVGSPEWVAALEEFDAGLSSLLRRLPSGVTSLLTADHGMVTVDPSRHLDIAEVPALRDGVRVLAGETRAVHVHAHRGEEEAVVERWREVLGEGAHVLSGARIAEAIGEGPGVELVGAALVLMTGEWGVVDSRTQSAAAIAMPGVHGSVTDAERLVPAVVLS